MEQQSVASCKAISSDWDTDGKRDWTKRGAQHGRSVAHALRLLSRNGRSIRTMVQIRKPVWLKALLDALLIVGVRKHQNLHNDSSYSQPSDNVEAGAGCDIDILEATRFQSKPPPFLRA